jgi:hypothetical protein
MRVKPSCSHCWIDPDEPAIVRAPYSPIVGPCRRQMKAGKQYRCCHCGAVLCVPTFDAMTDWRAMPTVR